VKFFLFILLISNALSAHFVTCNLRCQLANQMFEIAATVAYGLDHNLTPVFPNIDKAVGGQDNLKYVFPSIDTSNPNVRFKKIKEQKEHIYLPLKYIEESNICLSGYFQSEKYFVHHQDTIRKLFAPSDEIKKYIQDNWGNYLQTNCVAMHVRTFHKDSARWQPEKRFEGGLNYFKDYFKRAINCFPSNYTIFVFSDDIAWCKKNLPINQSRFIIVENNPRHIDLFLMSSCKHQIISPDSSFSWWAAWLNDNPNKQVITPKISFCRDELDFIPESWKKI
jgi:hypothetical protein